MYTTYIFQNSDFQIRKSPKLLQFLVCLRVFLVNFEIRVNFILKLTASFFYIIFFKFFVFGFFLQYIFLISF